MSTLIKLILIFSSHERQFLKAGSSEDTVHTGMEVEGAEVAGIHWSPWWSGQYGIQTHPEHLLNEWLPTCQLGEEQWNHEIVKKMLNSKIH